MNKVILVGGGTGGHCIPIVAVYKEFLKQNISCLIISDKRGSTFFSEIEKKNLIILKTPTKTISKFQQLLNFPIIFIQILLILFKLKGSHVIGFGGYITLPVLMSANFIKIKTSIHEANAIIGKANRILSKNALNIFLTFSETKMLNNNFSNKIHKVGLPLREEVINSLKKNDRNNKRKYIISIIGGSQGSHSLSKEVPMALIKFSKKIKYDLIIYHQCRKEDIQGIKHKYRAFGVSSEVNSYFQDMPNKMSKSDLIISRSGASTINEIIFIKKPSILIPYPFAVDDHQFHNADILQKISCTKVIKNNDLTSSLLLNNLLRLINNDNKTNYISHKLQKLTYKNTSLRMIRIIQESNVN